MPSVCHVRVDGSLNWIGGENSGAAVLRWNPALFEPVCPRATTGPSPLGRETTFLGWIFAAFHPTLVRLGMASTTTRIQEITTSLSAGKPASYRVNERGGCVCSYGDVSVEWIGYTDFVLDRVRRGRFMWNTFGASAYVHTSSLLLRPWSEFASDIAMRLLNASLTRVSGTFFIGGWANILSRRSARPTLIQLHLRWVQQRTWWLQLRILQSKA